MMHKNRAHKITTVQTREELVAAIFRPGTHVSCAGWRWDGFLFLNDQTSEDGAFEVAVVREYDQEQVDSITIGWIDAESFAQHLRSIHEWQPLGVKVSLRDHPAISCSLCR